jgi:hypothetical protein
MTELLRLRGLGAEVDVRCTGDAARVVAAAMRQAWSRCLVPLVADDGGRLVAEPVDIHLVDEGRLPFQLMMATQRITRSLIAARAGQLLMLHAGAVSHPESGVGLVYVAPGGTGKTTLSRLLGRSFGYLTDEAVGIDESGTIHPYPKPLSVRRPEQADLKDEVSPDALELLPGPARARVGQLVLLDRRAEACEVALEEVPFMDAVFELVEQTSSLAELPRPLHCLADLIDATGPVLRLRYSEAAHVEEDLMALIGELG